MRGDERLARRGLAPGAIASCFRCLLWLSSHIDIACSDRAFAFFIAARTKARAGRRWDVTGKVSRGVGHPARGHHGAIDAGDLQAQRRRQGRGPL